MIVHSLTWPTLLCACVFATASQAFFPVEVRSTSLHRAAAPAPGEWLRQIPEDAKKGAMWPPNGRRVRINDKIMVLAPGATIRDINNRLVQPEEDPLHLGSVRTGQAYLDIDNRGVPGTPPAGQASRAPGGLIHAKAGAKRPSGVPTPSSSPSCIFLQ